MQGGRGTIRGIELLAALLPAAGALLIGTIVGCGNESTEVPVSGRVTLDGTALDAASVEFIPQDGNLAKARGGTTDAEGGYELGKGADPGSYRVVISKLAGAGALGPDPASALASDPQTIDTGPIRQLLPSHYSDPQQTVLTFTVEASGTDSADFKLRSN